MRFTLFDSKFRGDSFVTHRIQLLLFYVFNEAGPDLSFGVSSPIFWRIEILVRPMPSADTVLLHTVDKSLACKTEIVSGPGLVVAKALKRADNQFLLDSIEADGVRREFEANGIKYRALFAQEDRKIR
jgi:hypothetical protein